MIPIKKYNPAFLTDEELIEIFCVRLNEFNSIIETVKENDASVNQNVLVIGPRGSGKSTLLLRVAAEIKKDKKLSKQWHPIIFAEESYEISSIGEFWLECLFHLGDQYFNDTGDNSLQTAHQELHSELDDARLKTKCLAHIRDFADEHNKRLVLVIENLNMLFDSQLMDASDAGWSLRHTLQNDSRIMLLASSTSRFNAVKESGEALFDAFRYINLKPLNTDECAILWEKSCGKKPQKETMEAIRILTGGSSRLVSIIARFGAERSFHDLMKNLLDLVDDNTEYFKSHLEILPPQERRVYLALADLWKPATAKEVATRSRQTSSKVSAQLKRLIQRGVVIEVKSDTKKKKYYLAERMYNIYYLLRRKRNADSMVQALISFMMAYFTPKELPDLAQEFINELSNNTPPQKIFFTVLEKLCDELDTNDGKNIITSLPASLLKLNQIPASFKQKAITEKTTRLWKAIEKLNKSSTHINNIDKLKKSNLLINQIKELKSLSENSGLDIFILNILVIKLNIFQETKDSEKEVKNISEIINILQNSDTELNDTETIHRLVTRKKYLNTLIKSKAKMLKSFKHMLETNLKNPRDFSLALELTLFITAVAGKRAVLNILQGSKYKDYWLPLIVAIQRELSEPTNVAIEVEEVAKDIQLKLHKLESKDDKFIDKEIEKLLQTIINSKQRSLPTHK